MSRKEIRQQLEEWGEAKVKQMLADGHPFFGQVDSPYQTEVLLWLAEITEARLEARAEESLAISRKSLRNSELATRIAISAITLSIIMAILEIIKWYSK